MAYSAKILADSFNSATGGRLTTFEISYPRIVHGEIMTHRVMSRNSASSRAIPVTKLIKAVEEDPFIPIWWGKHQSGMQAHEELDETRLKAAREAWLGARDEAVNTAKYLNNLGLHRQIANRGLEPWMWITVIISATEWDNFFRLRCHPDAQPEIRKIAEMMQELYRNSTLEILLPGEWHRPLLFDEADLDDVSEENKCKISVGRCARVSYLTHDGKRDIEADIKLHDRLLPPKHFSPFEHVAQAWETPIRSGNFTGGWHQYRQDVDKDFLT